MRAPWDLQGGWDSGVAFRQHQLLDELSKECEPAPRYRAVFISDLHLGTPGCQAAALLEFLRHHTCDSLYLVGDIVDGWQLRRRWFWPQLHNDVVQKLLRQARKG